MSKRLPRGHQFELSIESCTLRSVQNGSVIRAGLAIRLAEHISAVPIGIAM